MNENCLNRMIKYHSQRDRVRLWLNVTLQSLAKLQGYEELGVYTYRLKANEGNRNEKD